MTFESFTKYNEIFLGRYNKNLPPTRDSPRELLILHQDPSETVSNEDGKANTCKPTCEKGSKSECVRVNEYRRKCCMAKHFFHCEKREAVNTSLFSRVSNKDLFWDFKFAHWTDDVFWCKTKNISRIFHFGLVWGRTSPKN